MCVENYEKLFFEHIAIANFLLDLETKFRSLIVNTNV